MRYASVALLMLALVCPPDSTRACTIFKVTRGSTTLVGNNEDDDNPATKVWFLAPEDGKHGRVLFGYSDGIAQGGMNDQGLFFDWVADNRQEGWVRDPKKLNFPGSVSEKILEEASTVDEALKFYEVYNETAFLRSRTLLADKTGDSAVVAWKNGKLEVTRGQAGLQAIGFGQDKALEKLGRLANASIRPVQAILAGCVQSGQWPTQYSNLYDLQRGEVYVYRFHENLKIKFNLKQELKKGHHYYDLPRLVAQLKLPIMTDNKTQPIAQVDPSIYARYSGQYRITPDYVLKVSTDHGKLFIEAPDTSRSEMYPASATRFFIRTLDAHLEFRAGGDGNWDRVELSVQHRESVGTRVHAGS